MTDLLRMQSCAIRGPQKLCKFASVPLIKSSAALNKEHKCQFFDTALANKCALGLSLFAASKETRP
jgi:hypothetical protein